jgi:O-antigen ligase
VIERWTRWIVLAVLILVVPNVVSALVEACATGLHAALAFAAYVVMVGVFLTVALKPVLTTRLLLLTHLLGFQFVVGVASMKALFPLMVLCLAALLARLVMTRQPILDRAVLHPGILLCVAVSVVVYFRSPQLPTFGMGRGSGFSQYVQYFCSYLPLLLLPLTLDRNELPRIPLWLLGGSLASVVFQTVVIQFAPPALQVHFFTPEQVSYFFQGRYSYLQTSASLLFLSGLAICGFGKGGIQSVLGTVGLFGGAFGLLLTGTRTLVLSGAVAVLYVLAVKRRWVWMAGGCLFLAVLLFVRVNVPTVSNPLAGMVVRSVSFTMSDDTVRRQHPFAFHESETMGWRFSLWRQAAASIFEHPWFGRGFSASRWGGVPLSFMGPRDQEYAIFESTLDIGATHNLWLGPFVTFGVLAGLGFVCFVVSGYRRLWRAAITVPPDHDLYVATHLLGAWLVMLANASISTGGTVATELLLVLAMVFALSRQLSSPPVGDGSGSSV